jgi:plastocyanin
MARMRNHLSVWFLAAACAALAVTACGSNSTGPSTATTTITIANNTVSPKNVTVARGSSVAFVNNDSRAHNMTSDPHPEHTDCPEINQVGVINPGQTKQTGNMTTNRTVCGFHDHDAPAVTGLQGSITIQ